MKRNIQRIALSIALAAAAFPFCAAQEVTRSAQIPGLRPYKVDLEYMPRAEKDSVRMVAELWEGYVESFTSSSVDEARRRSFWVDGSPDYLQEFDDGNLLYASFRENRILDIRKLGGGTYELIAATFSKLPGEEYDNWVEAVLRVCVKAVASGNGGKNNPFRLCNWLDAEFPSLTKTIFKGIEYYCVPGCGVPKRPPPDWLHLPQGSSMNMLLSFKALCVMWWLRLWISASVCQESCSTHIPIL